MQYRSSRQLSFLYSRFASRRFTTSPCTHNAANHLSAAVKEETQDVTAIDSLLNVVKLRVDPHLSSILPMRIPSLWAEARLTLAQAEAQREEALRSSEAPSTNVSLNTLPPRNMHDSYTEFVLPFATDPNLLEEYVNASGGIRIGKLMEHLDSLAGSISYKHVLGPSRSTLTMEDMGLYIVTAGVERIDMLRPLNSTHDLRFSGQVIFTGRSSMEVAVRIESLAADTMEKDETILLGRFSMVCRDAKRNQARPISPLVTSTEEEKTLFAFGQELKLKRDSLAKRSLSRVPPSSAEAAALHENFLKFGEAINNHELKSQIKAVSADSKGLEYIAELVPMGETCIEKCMLMFPQERNLHSRVFGGYLMRLAYELGFSNASMFCRGRVRFLALDKISFKLPVPIGSILKLSSAVLYDEIIKEREHGEDNAYQLVHVGVKANVVDIKTGSEKTTNEFRFTWRGEEKLAGHDSGPQKIRKVVPKTYKEAMLWLGARREVAIGDEIRDLTARRREQGNQ